MKRREQVLLGVGAIVVIGSVWLIFAPAPGGGGKANHFSLEEAQKKTATSRANARKLEKEQVEVEPRVKERAYGKPADQLVPVVVGNLQAAAEHAGIHLREVRPLRPKLVTDESDPNAVQKTGAVKSARAASTTHEFLGARVPVEVRFRAQFQPNVIKFLYDLENTAGRMVIDKISITSADAKFRTVEVSAQITVFTRSSTGTAGGAAGEIADDRPTKG